MEITRKSFREFLDKYSSYADDAVADADTRLSDSAQKHARALSILTNNVSGAIRQEWMDETAEERKAGRRPSTNFEMPRIPGNWFKCLLEMALAEYKLPREEPETEEGEE